MKPGRLALLSFFTLVLCLACYEFLDVPTALFFSTAHQTTKNFFEPITQLGLSWPYLTAVFAGFVFFKFIKKNPAPANVLLFLFIAVIISGLANDLIKFVVGRSRPCLLITHGIYAFKPFSHQYDYASFPSGHANTITALCYGLSLATGRFKYALSIIALAVMASRVVLEAHFLSDVLFGACLAIVITELIAVGFGKRKPELESREPEMTP
jgi:membrane-associated phospholipid phosphatase